MKRLWVLMTLGIAACVAALMIFSGHGSRAEVHAAPQVGSSHAPAATLVVTSTADSGAGTLRQALADAVSGDIITFDAAVFPPTNPVTIAATSQLPNLVAGNVTVDASNAGVIVDGTDTPPGDDGFFITSNGNTIKGLQILHFGGDGVVIKQGAQNNIIGGDRTVGAGPTGEGNVISGNRHGIRIEDSGTMSNTIIGNYIGTDASGTVVISNTENGVHISGGASLNLIGGSNATPGGACSGECNLISGNGNHNVEISVNTTTSNTISGNFVGTDASGLTAFSSGNPYARGVFINEAPRNTVGGTSSGQRNIISGGIHIYAIGADENVVIGNYIGLSSDGVSAIGGNWNGVGISEGTGNRVGGSTAGERNVISGNDGGSGIYFWSSTHGNIVIGNYIGTDATGTLVVPNRYDGVGIADGSTLNVIGGANPGEGNLINGNTDNGIGIYGTGTANNMIIGNYIGTDANGTSDLGNGRAGVLISGAAQWNTVGVSNTIAFNGGDGVHVDGSNTLSNTITRSSIHSNAGKGIELTNGGNIELAAPIITNFDLDAGTVTGTACPGCIVEIFSDSSDEGEVYEGQTTADGAGNFTYSKGASFTGPYLTTTATDAGGNTSEFSARTPATCTVTSTADSGLGTLRFCLENAASGDLINFDTAVFLPSSPVTIALTSALPEITQGNLTIDASDAGVILDGSALSSGDGLHITSDGNAIKGLQILYFPDRGVRIDGSSHNLIGGSNATPGGACSGDCNLISGNSGDGVHIEGSDTTSNTVAGNYIGTDINGTSALGNQGFGVFIGWDAEYNRVGGSSAAEWNILSGNHSGVRVSGAMSNTIAGNYIGTDVTGAVAIRNTWDGIRIDSGSKYNIVGGTTEGERNVISGNGAKGVFIADPDTDYNVIVGNYLGTDATGTAAIANGMFGVVIYNWARYNRVGGASTAERNLISGNNRGGVDFNNAHENQVIGNYIGTDVSGLAVLSNVGSGVDFINGSQRNIVGGPGAGEGNIIAYNTGPGAYVIGSRTVSNTITHNSIYSNGGLGIDNVDGGNRELIPPAFIRLTGGNTVTGTVCANCTVEIFSDDVEEGKVYEGTVKSDGSGWFAFAKPGGFVGPNVTATATDSDGNTSEFSYPVALIDTAPPAVSQTAASPTQPTAGTNVTITTYALDVVNGVAAVTATVRSRNPNVTATLTLYDDGAHGDGIAGDDVYGNLWTTPVEPREYLVDIYAVDSSGYSGSYINQVSFSTMPLPALPDGTWESWSNVNYVQSLTFQGNILWAATAGGIVRWDTAAGCYTKYTVANGLASNNNAAVTVDHDGKVWTGAYGGGGLSFWNGSTWQRDNRVDRVDINAVVVDNANRLWVGTENGLLILDGDVITTHVTLGDYVALASNWVNAIAFDKDDNAWLGTSGGVNRLTPDGTWTTFNIFNSGLASNYVASVGVDSAGNKWFGTYGGGVSKLALDDSWTTYNTSNSGLATDVVYAVSFDSDSRPWFGGWGSVSTLSGTTWVTFTASNSGLANAAIEAIIVDKTDNVWFGTYGGGISKLQAGSWSSSSDAAASVTDSAPPEIIAGSWNAKVETPELPTLPVKVPAAGVQSSLAQAADVRTADNGTWTTYTVPDILPHNYAHGLAVDDQGRAWIGTYGGAAMFDGTAWVTYTTANSGLYSNYVWAAIIDQSGKKWFAGQGVSVLSGTEWITYTAVNSGLAHDGTRDIAFDSAGYAWIATYAGVSVFNGTNWITYTTANSDLPSDWVYDVVIDQSDVKWFATYSGLSRFDGSTWTNYTTADGLLASYIAALALDNDRRVWFSYDTGVAVLDDGGTADKSDDILLTFTAADGPIWNGVQGIAVDAQGRKWFGTKGQGASVLDDRGTWGKADDCWKSFTSADGLPNNYAWAVAIDPDGKRCWFGTLGGVGLLTLWAAPSISQIVPNQGTNDVPSEINIYGLNFSKGISVTLGTTPPIGLATRRISSSHLRATVPAGLPAGTYDLTVTNPDGGSDTLANAYTVFDSQVENDDLYAQSHDLWNAPPTIRQGEQANLGLVVHRQGGKSTLSNVIVRFYDGNPDGGGTAIGDGTIYLLSPRSSASTTKVPWNPAVAGDYVIYARIDPDNVISETIEVNNTVSATITVLPPAGDTTPPMVTSFTINDGAEMTAIPTVTLAVSAEDDVGGSGMGSIFFVEFEFVQAAMQWVPVQASGWLSYTTNYTWTLIPVAGVKYIQAWAADKAGNISLYPYKDRINYLLPSDGVAIGQVRLYRQYVGAGQMLTVIVNPISGDPDLYVWPPTEGAPAWVSNNSAEADQLNIEVTESGTYQIEVYGYSAAEYTISINVSGGRMRLATEDQAIQSVNADKPLRPAPMLLVSNEPPGQMAIPAAPITGDNHKLYLPLIIRQAP